MTDDRTLFRPLPSCKKSESFNNWILRKSQKTLKMGHFGPLLPQNGPKFFFSENRAPSLFEDYNFTSSCKKSENFNEPISRKTHNRRTNERTDERTNERTDERTRVNL